jgi:hypothetical protein
MVRIVPDSIVWREGMIGQKAGRETGQETFGSLYSGTAAQA